MLDWALGPVLLTDASAQCWADAQLCQWDRGYPGEVSSEVASGFQLNFTWVFKLTKAQGSSPQSAVVHQWLIFVITDPSRLVVIARAVLTLLKYTDVQHLNKSIITILFGNAESGIQLNFNAVGELHL